MAILGFLGLSGMLVKNAIVLIDQIESELQVTSQKVFGQQLTQIA